MSTEPNGLDYWWKRAKKYAAALEHLGNKSNRVTCNWLPVG